MRAARRGPGAQPHDVVRLAGFGLIGGAYPGETPEVASGANF